MTANTGPSTRGAKSGTTIASGNGCIGETVELQSARGRECAGDVTLFAGGMGVGTQGGAILASGGCAATFVLPGRPQTYKPPRHRYGQKHFYCGHKKEIKIARRLLEETWGDRDSLTDKAVRLDIWACCV